MIGTLSSTALGTKTITATVGAVTIADHPSVTVNPAAASQLAFTVQPTDVLLGPGISAVVVTARDQFGNTATGFTGDVLMAIGTDGSLLGDATLGGTRTVAAASGAASFTDLTINRPGAGFRLAATAIGVATGATSDPFTIVALTP